MERAPARVKTNEVGSLIRARVALHLKYWSRIVEPFEVGKLGDLRVLGGVGVQLQDVHGGLWIVGVQSLVAAVLQGDQGNPFHLAGFYVLPFSCSFR